MVSFPIKTKQIVELEYDLPAIVQKSISQSLATPQPYIIHMLGVPGVGKTTIIDIIEKEIGRDTAHILGFDRLMTEMAEYKNNTSLETSFAQFEIPAREAGYALLKNLIEKKSNILFDHGGSFSEHVDILNHAKEQFGYKIIMIEVTCDEQTAKDRLIKREKEINRHTPLHYVDERSVMIKELSEKYQTISDHYFKIKNDTKNDLENFKTTQLTKITTALEEKNGQ